MFAEQSKPDRLHARSKPLMRCRKSEDQSIPGSSSETCDSSVSFDNLKPQNSSTPQNKKVTKPLQS